MFIFAGFPGLLFASVVRGVGLVVWVGWGLCWGVGVCWVLVLSCWLFVFVVVRVGLLIVGFWVCLWVVRLLSRLWPVAKLQGSGPTPRTRGLLRFLSEGGPPLLGAIL